MRNIKNVLLDAQNKSMSNDILDGNCICIRVVESAAYTGRLHDKNSYVYTYGPVRVKEYNKEYTTETLKLLILFIV